MKEKDRRYRNILFIVACIIGVMFLISPVILRIPFINSFITCFLKPLGIAEYKSSYIQILGAILGTFLAVTGALWTQRKIDEIADKKQFKESTLIVFYDFDFAFNDITNIMSNYFSSTNKIIDKLENIEFFKQYTNKFRLYIDDNWIQNVAKLSYSLSANDIKFIYHLYGELTTIKQIFNNKKEELTLDEANLAFSIMLNIIDFGGASKFPIKVVAKVNNDIDKTMEKLGNIVGY